MEKSIDTLSRYGSTFQTKTISCLISDKTFLDQIIDVLSVDFYDSEAKRWLVEKTIKYYEKYKKPPTPDFFKTELMKIDSDTLKVSIVDEVRKAWNNKEASDLQYVKDEFLEFAKNQKVKLAILNSVDLLNDGNYGKIKVMLDEALNAGLSKDIGHIYKEEVETRLAASARPTVKTGWDVIDNLMDGGLGAGELGVCVGASGAGKSWLLAKLGVEAARDGLNVVHYTLELDENQTGLRYDSILTGYSPTEVREHKDEVREEVKALEGNISIKNFPTKSASVQTLNAHFDRQQILHGRPDVILIDYADLLSSTSGNDFGDNSYLQMGNIYTQIRKLAGDLQVPVWTVSQATRSAIKEDVIEANLIADSYKKIMIADFVMSLSRKKSDKLSNTGRFHVIKNRFGQDGITFPAIMDTEHGRIVLYDSDSPKGGELMMKMNESEGEAARRRLSQEYSSYKNKSDSSSKNGSSVDDLSDMLNSKKDKSTNISV